MKNLNRLAAALAIATAAGSAFAATAIDNWRNAENTLTWKNGTNELCWRDAFWTPATAAPGCDGALGGVPEVAQRKPDGVTPPPTNPPPKQPDVQPVKVTYNADAFFDFDKSVLKPEGKAKLDDLASKVKGINLEVIIAIGHTDSIGSAAYNQGLSVRRAEAVKAYLAGKGIDSSRIYTEGKGKTQPVADNRTREGRAQNRRVEVEVVGTTTAK